MEKTNILRAAVSLIGLTLGVLLATSRSASAVPQTMILGQNTITEFYCPASSVNPRWNISGMIQGDYQQDFLSEVLNINIEYNHDLSGVNSSLHITGSVENNGTTLICNTDLANIHIKVMVQGKLSALSRVEPITTTPTAILLRWDPPFTLDITDVDPDIAGYTVYCRNLHTGMTDAVNVTEPEFSFTGLLGEDPDPCPVYVYEFRVSAWNVVGESENSTVLQTSFREVPQAVNAIAEVNSSDLMINVHFTITIVDLTCHGRLPESIDVTVTVDGRAMPVYTYTIEGRYEELNFEIQNLPTGNSCNAVITARNRNGTSQPTHVVLDCQPRNSGTDDPRNTPQSEMEKKPIIPVVVGVCAAAAVCVVVLTVALLCFVKYSRERDQVNTADLGKPTEDNDYTVHAPTKSKIPPHDQTTTTPERQATTERQPSTSSTDSQTSANSQSTLLADSQDEEKREQQLHYADLPLQPNCQPAPPPFQPAGVEYVQILQQRTLQHKTDGQ